MELGRIKLRCQGVNILHAAVHEDHGVVWTDGQGIFLTPLSVFEGQIENQEHSKLGEFDRGVKSIHWSSNQSKSLCYMCVVHDKNISIWKVEGLKPNLSFKQIRKINIQPIPQGCLWNPGRDILCVLCSQQCSLYYSHIQNKGSQVLLQLDKDKIRCGCWSADGTKLVICIGTSLMVYHWSDIDSSVSVYTAIPWTVPGLSSRISSVVPISPSRVVIAADLPLESVYKQKDTFIIPDLLNSNSNDPIRNEIAEDVIKPKGKESTHIDSLLHLQTNPESLVEYSSRLDCIYLPEEKNPVKVTSINIKGILSPDLLLYQANLSEILVGSNNQPLLQVYSFDNKQFSKLLDIELDKDDRPKGLASLPKSCCHVNQDGVLVLCGKQIPTDVAFPSSSSTVNMKSVLKFFNLKHGYNHKTPLSHTQSVPSIPSSTAANGSLDNKDFDSIYESVLNFDTTLKNSAPDIRKIGNRQNNNISGDSNHCVTKGADDCKIYETVGGQKSEAMEPEPPKRPVRKKRSMRHNRDDLSRQSSGSSQDQGKTGHKSQLLMEYLSDSPESSPRDLVTDTDSTSEKSPDVELKKLAKDKSAKETRAKVNEAVSNIVQNKGVLSEELNTESRLVESEHSLPQNGELTVELSCLKLPTDIRNESTECAKIMELGGDNSVSREHLEIEKTDFDSQKRDFEKVNFENLYKEEFDNHRLAKVYIEKRLKAKDLVGDLVGGNPVTQRRSTSLESLEDIDTILKEQNKKIAKLQEQISMLSRRVDESTCVLPTRYQSLSKPDTVQICLWCRDGLKIEKKFLLDNGRIQLEQIKKSFSIETVEIHIDNEACVVGCNIDGYIPMRFEPGSTVTISGKPAST